MKHHKNLSELLGVYYANIYRSTVNVVSKRKMLVPFHKIFTNAII